MSSLSVILISLLLLFAVSCGDETSAPVLGDEIPYYVAKGFEQTTVSSQGRVEIKASTVEAFQKEDRNVFFEAELTEYDSDGKLNWR